ncbi:hypothetical protein V6X73_09445 [Spiribacter sp. 390]|uniref:Major tropism determinant second domain-containing protein n=1 Tax=Spiribacter pallidus TaxID=1987936 RepID=A0ABV3TE66_9GAMM
MTITKITALPPAPVITDTESQFASKASAFVSALDGFVTDANALASDVDSALAGSLVQFDGFAGVWSAGTFNSGQVVFHTPSDAFYIALQDGETAEPPGGNWRQLGTAESTSYDNTTSGLAATDVQAAIDEVAAASPSGYFAKANRDSVAWNKTGNDTAETGQTIYVEVGGSVLEIASGTSIAMPTLSAGTDYAIWVAPDGTLEADASFNVAPTAGGRRIGGFHYAPGGNASFSLNAGDGGTTPQINEFSFYDLKWRPSVADPRGLTLVGDGAFWCGIYHLAGDHLVGPPHRHGVNPARDGNPPDLIDGSGNYPDAQPMNIFESLWYHGFRTPRVEDFQLLAFGTKEAASRGSDPGTTGLPGGSTDAQFTSHWGVIQSTGVISLWSNDSILSSSAQTLPNPSRGNRFRVVRFATLGGAWPNGSESGSRYVNTDPAPDSNAGLGGRGVCDHLILE